MNLNDIMHRVPACTPEAPLRVLVRMFVAGNYDMIPVVDSRLTKRPVGTIRSTDVIHRLATGDAATLRLCAMNVMAAPVVNVPQETTIEEACRLLDVARQGELLVVDADGAYVGVVTEADLA